MEREAHTPTNSALVFVPSPHLKNHLTTRESIIFKESPAPQLDPPAVDALSKKVKVYQFIRMTGLNLKTCDFMIVGRLESVPKVLYATVQAEGAFPSKSFLLHLFQMYQLSKIGIFFYATLFNSHDSMHSLRFWSRYVQVKLRKSEQIAQTDLVNLQ
jgi:hypothetical protein